MYGTSWTYLLRSNRCDRHAEWVLHVANTIEIHKFSTMSAYSISVRIRYLSLPFFFSFCPESFDSVQRESVRMWVFAYGSGYLAFASLFIYLNGYGECWANNTVDFILKLFSSTLSNLSQNALNFTICWPLWNLNSSMCWFTALRFANIFRFNDAEIVHIY